MAVAEVVKTFGFPANDETVVEFRDPEIKLQQTTNLISISLNYISKIVALNVD